MKKILPLVTPSIAHAPNDTYIASILEGDIRFRGWMMSNFLNIKFNKKMYRDSFCPRNMFKICPHFDMKLLSYKEVGSKYTSFVDFCIESINNNQYAYVILNIKYIPPYKYDGDIDHNVLVYGYDDDHKDMYIADFFDNGKYTFQTCSFDLMERSFTHLKDIERFDESGYYLGQHIKFNCISVNDYEFDKSLSIGAIRTGITEFLSSARPVIEICNDIEGSEVPFSCYGLDFYDFLVEIDNRLRPIKLLCDFKKLWINRLSYLNDMGWIRNFDKHMRVAVDTYNMSNKILNSYLKYAILGDDDDTVIIDKIKSYIITDKNMTAQFLSDILTALVY